MDGELVHKKEPTVASVFSAAGTAAREQNRARPGTDEQQTDSA